MAERDDEACDSHFQPMRFENHKVPVKPVRVLIKPNLSHVGGVEFV